jgi:hypothetical protein
MIHLMLQAASHESFPFYEQRLAVSVEATYTGEGGPARRKPQPWERQTTLSLFLLAV